jgi:hypothetical protein
LVLSLALFPLLLIIDKAHAAEGLTAQVYNVLGQNAAPYIPQGASPAITTNVSNIDFQWGSGSVLGGPSEDVIVRFTGSIRSDSTQDISFLATADDGTKLYIDNVLVADDWYDKGGGGTTTDPISFTAGVPKTIELMYYENGGGANVFLHWDQSGSMDIIPASAFTSQAAPVVKTIGPPRNLTISSGETSTVLTWEAPNTGNTQPERYAISFNCTGCNGWGIATGNVGGPNSLNTAITIEHSLLDGLMPAGTVWSFHIRSDNDTFALYSENSNVVTGSTYVAPAPEPYVAAPLPFNYTYRVDENGSFSINAPSGKMIETITAWYGDPNDGNYGALVTDTLTASHSGETTTVIYANNDVFGDPVPGVGKILIANVTFIDLPGPTPEEIAAQQAAEAEIAAQVAAQALAQQAEAARIQAETAAIIAAQAAAAQAEANRIAAEEAAREAARIKAEAEAKAEADRIEAEIEAARIQAEIEAQEEAERIAAEVKAAEEKAEAEAKAEAERIAAEEEAERIAAEEAAAEAEAKAKAEEEAIAEEIRQAEEDAKAEADAIEAEEKAKELEEEKAAEEEKAKEEDLKEAIEDAKDGKELTEEQKEVVVEALLEDLKPGEAVTAAAVAASGVSYADLPPETPVEVRTDENGNALVITAEVAANVELVQDPGALLEAAFTDPGAALAALGSIGADMTEEEREEATDMVVATVVAAGAAINAAAVATGGATGGSTGGGGSSGGGSGSNSPGSRGGRRW